ncbi:uncharacterized protein TNCT_177801 [Trichonephila clavata]|uniref:Uncharacterized protein n=1 Tax=Trichonephila clavata TaxID=2740835 RepID=A0A8X6FWF0_TRICU|nr:uncharacterized protein TNCT_177801 [Trichonephila clavata]
MEMQDFEKWYNAEQAQEILAVFKKILTTKNQIHFEELFNYLNSFLDDNIKKQLPTLSTGQKLDFFRQRPNVFVIQGHFVSKFRKSELSITEAIKKFYSAIHFILQRYQPLHFLEIKKFITFLFEDVAHYIMILSSEKEKELLNNIHNISIDDGGVLTLTIPSKIQTEHISSEDKCLITIAFYLKLHGRTHFKKVVQELKKLKQKEFDAICSLSESELLKLFKKFGDYIKIYEDGFISLCDEYYFYECDYQKLSHQHLSAHDNYSQSQENDHLNSLMSSYNSISNTNKILMNNMSTPKDENLILERKFYCAVLFLLNCFDPMHYLEIKECILFIMQDVSKILRKIPHANLQETFQNIPFTVMDGNGFLEITELCQMETNISNEEMIKLFVVYYLGFCGKTHWTKLVKELTKRAPESVSVVISALPASKQEKFFKKFAQFFQISKNGYLNVNSSFNLPYCEYHEVNKNYSKNDNSLVKGSNNISKKSKQTLVFKDQSKHLRYNCAITKKISCSIAYLLKQFELKISIKLFCIILHVLDDVKTHVLNLSALHQTDLIKKALLPFTINEENVISPTFNQLEANCLTEKEMEFLFFAYYFSQYRFYEMHYNKAIDIYYNRFGKNPIDVCSDPDKYWFFKESKSIFTVGNYGIVKLCSLPVLKLRADFFSATENNEKVLNCLDSEYSLNYYKQCNLDSANQYKSENLSNSSMKNFKNCKETGKIALPFTSKKDTNINSISNDKWSKTDISFVSDERYKTLCKAACFILNFFDSLHYTCLKKIIPNVYEDTGNFLNDLSLSSEEKIFKNIPSTVMDEKGYLKLIKSNVFHSLSKKKQRLLFIIAYLAVNGTTHYTKLITELENSGLWFYGLTPQQQRGVFLSNVKFMKMSEKGYLALSDIFGFSTDDNLILQSNGKFLHSNFNNCDKNALAPQKVSSAKYEHSKECVQLETHVPPSTNMNETEDSCNGRNKKIKDDKLVKNEQIKVNEKTSNTRTEHFDRSVQYKECLFPSTKVTKTETKCKQKGGEVIKETETTTLFNANCFIPTEENLTPKIDWIIEKVCSSKDTHSWDPNKLNTSIIHSVNVETQNISKNKSFKSEEKCAEEVSLPSSSKEIILSPNDALNKSNNWQNCNNEHILGEKRKLKSLYQKIVRKIVNSISFLIKYFNPTIDRNLVHLVFQVVTEIRFKFLFMHESNQIKILQKVFGHFASPLEKTDPDKLFFETDKLSDEEENLLFVAYAISCEGKLHYKKLYEKFFKCNKEMPTWMKTGTSALNHIGSLDYLFLIKSGCFELQPFEVPELDLKTFSKISTFKRIDKNTDKPPAIVSLCADKVSEKKTQTCSNNSSKTCGKTIFKNLDSGCSCLSKKIQAGVIFILQYYHLQAEVLLLKALLHALDKNQIYVNLSDEDQRKFLRKCFHIFSINNKSVVFPSFSSTPVIQLEKEEKMLLFAVFMLCKHTKLHYRYIFKELKNQVAIPFTDREQIHYFKRRSNHFQVLDTGYVSVKNLPDIKFNEFQFHKFFQISAMNSVDSYPNNAIIDLSSDLQKAYGASLNEESNNVNCKNPVKDLDLFKQNHKIQHAMDQIAKDNFSGFEKMDKMHKKMTSAVFFLLSYFKLEFGSHLICILLHALKDVSSYFLSLQELDKSKFVQESLSFLENNCSNFTSNYVYSPPFCLSDNEEDMLFLVYILSYENELHCLEIFDMYTLCDRNKPVTLATHIKLYKYFSKSKEFTLDSNGFVKLNKQFDVGQNSAISSMDCVSSYAAPSKSSALIFTSNRGSDIINALKNNKMLMTGNLILDENSKCSNNFQVICGYIRESSIFLNNFFKSYPLEHIVRTILYNLNHNETFCNSDCIKVFFNFDINVKKHNSSFKYSLSEEEKDLLIFTCELIHLGPTHYSVLFKQLQLRNRNSWKWLTYLEQQKYVVKRSHYFIFSGEGVVSLCDIPCIKGVNLNNFVLKRTVLISEYHEEKLDAYYDELINSGIQSLNIEKGEPYYDKLIDKCCKSLNKNKVKYNEHSRDNTRQTSVNLLRINAEKESKNSNTSPATYKTPGACKFSNVSKTEAELKCMNFFTILLGNVEMAASPQKYFHLASKEVQNHIRDSYGGDINLFLHIHEISGALSLD